MKKLVIILVIILLIAVGSFLFWKYALNENNPPSNPVASCGNGKVETGEQCDGTSCSDGKTCNNCLCEAVAKTCSIPSDCGSFNDCINSKCVQINPPSLP